MKKNFLTLMLAFSFLAINAQENKKSWINNVKLSGYGIGEYQHSSENNENSNSFSIRMIRLILDGNILDDFAWRIQMQVNGNTSTLGSSPRLVDMYAEWKKYDFARIRIGQFKRPFTYENPMHPIDQGFMGLGQNIMKLSGFTDRTGEHACNGRDIGLQIQGDLIKNARGRNLLHYQIGVFNGQGINVKDVDNRKDIIAGVWVMPVAGMRIGVFGWEGSYARKGTWTDDSGNQKTGIRSLSKHRYAISGEYLVNDWTFRSEYIHSTGYGFKTTYQKPEDAKDAEIDAAAGDKADGVYALAIAPIIKKKLYAKARYDVYRNSGEWNKATTQYEFGLNYKFSSNLEIVAGYALVNDKTLADHNYSMADVQLSFRF